MRESVGIGKASEKFGEIWPCAELRMGRQRRFALPRAGQRGDFTGT